MVREDPGFIFVTVNKLSTANDLNASQLAPREDILTITTFNEFQMNLITYNLCLTVCSYHVTYVFQSESTL